MSAFDDLPVAADPDPIGADDPTALRAEILRLREALLAANGRTEVLRDRIVELEGRERELDAANRSLHQELARNPVVRVLRAHPPPAHGSDVTGPLDDLLEAYGQPAVVATPPQPTSFSVVVRTQGRRPNSLNEALDSLAAQTFQNFDVVVVVHGSSHEADEVTKAIGDRLTGRLRIVAVKGGGRATPLNTGLDHVTGSHLCFLDDDDLVREIWLSAFADAIAAAPGQVIRAVTQSQEWTSEGGSEPIRAVGEIERPFPDRFDLLAHMSLNLTPICSLAYPRSVIDRLGMRFCDELPVYEDWDFLMRAAMAVGVVSIPDETSLYRRLDSGNADTAESIATWDRAHAMVIDRLSAQPVVLPIGDARRLAGTHFVTGDRSRHEADLAIAEARIDQLTRSPIRWLQAWSGRVSGALRHRLSTRRP